MRRAATPRPNRGFARVHRLCGREHLPPELDDRNIAGAQLVAAAVGQRADGFPHDDVLIPLILLSSVG